MPKIRFFLIVAIVCYLVLAIPQLADPLHYDEVEFVKAGVAIVEQGVPYYNRGYINDVGLTQQYQYAFYHPPLYVYTLGLSFAIFGQGEAAARLVGVICGLITLLLTYYIGRELSPDPNLAEITAVAATCFLAIQPYFIQSSLLIDIDGSVQLLFIMLFFATHIYLRHAPTQWRVLALAFAFALTASTKLTTVFALTGALLLFHLLRRDWKRALFEGILTPILGVGLFLLGWWAYSTTLNVRFTEVFDWTLMAGSGIFRGLFSFGRVKPLLGVSIPWITPLFFIGLLFAAVWRMRRWWRKPKTEPFDVIFIFGYGVYYIYFVANAGGFPKYQIPALPFLSICLMYALVETIDFSRISKDFGRILVFCLIGLVIYGVFVLGDTFLLTSYHLVDMPTHTYLAYIFKNYVYSLDPEMLNTLQSSFLTWGRRGMWQYLSVLWPIDWWPYACFLITLYTTWIGLNLLPVILVNVVLFYYSQKKSFRYWGQSLIWSFVIATVGLMLAINLVQFNAPYSTRYFYGDSGWREFAETIRVRIGDSVLYVSERDIAYYISSHSNFVDVARYDNTRQVILENGELYLKGPDLPDQPIQILVSRGKPIIPSASYTVTVQMGVTQQIDNLSSLYLVQYVPKKGQ